VSITPVEATTDISVLLLSHTSVNNTFAVMTIGKETFAAAILLEALEYGMLLSIDSHLIELN
jgi:hypothetical protein